MWGRIGNRKRKDRKIGRDVVKIDGEERRGERERGEMNARKTFL